jgi:hypothetical protein
MIDLIVTRVNSRLYLDNDLDGFLNQTIEFSEKLQQF